MNSEICFNACRNIYGKSSSTFWGIFIKIPKLIPRVATLLSGHGELVTTLKQGDPLHIFGRLLWCIFSNNSRNASKSFVTHMPVGIL